MFRAPVLANIIVSFKTLPEDKILDCSKLKEFADNNLILSQASPVCLQYMSFENFEHCS